MICGGGLQRSYAGLSQPVELSVLWRASPAADQEPSVLKTSVLLPFMESQQFLYYFSFSRHWDHKSLIEIDDF